LLLLAVAVVVKSHLVAVVEQVVCVQQLLQQVAVGH
jgi:hypothetical protein